ncbi:MAG: hypothetical protein SCJ94_06250 [Bacillota bacterium]|nr:hypothetical protein [Bacillota bacterium]
MSVQEINACIQRKLAETGMEKASAIEAAKWLDNEGLLKDNPNRPGNALRKLLLTEVISGAGKEKNLWYIYPDKMRKKKKAAVVVDSKEKSKIENLEQCYDLLADNKALSGYLDTDPLDLVAQIRDLTRVNLMDSASKVIEDFSASTNMTDTISMLYNKRMLGKVTVQCLHIIRKMGNLVQYEREQLNEKNSRAVAEMVCSSFMVYFDEAKSNGLI